MYWLLFCIGFKLQQTLARNITQSLLASGHFLLYQGAMVSINIVTLHYKYFKCLKLIQTAKALGL